MRQWTSTAPIPFHKKDLARRQLPSPEIWLKTHALFAKPYPRHEDSHARDLELLTRLEQLQQLPQTDGPQTTADWSFYKFILENPREQWLIQRQALKNINGQLPAASETDRSTLLAKIDKRALATWMISDEQLAKLLIGQHER